jgi:hypothetical protein
MPYYVVNAGRGRSTHIMKSKNPSIPGVGTFVVSNTVGFGGGTTKSTLCGLTATRYVNVFTPSEASCRECHKRWQLDLAAEAAKTPEQRQHEKVNAWVGAIVIFAAVLAVTIYMVTHSHH